jgi:hypothetical protein
LATHSQHHHDHRLRRRNYRYDLLLSLPFPQLADALAIEPKLVDQLVAYANKFTPQQRSVLPRETLEVLGLKG